MHSLIIQQELSNIKQESGKFCYKEKIDTLDCRP